MNIKPFKGYRYNAETVGNPGDCIAPPYDVIDPEEQDQLYQRHPNNIVRVTKGKKSPDDTETENVYSRAAKHLHDFIDQTALKQDAQETIYAYVQDFHIADTPHTRSGFVALGKLESYGGNIKPHEHTLEGPKADRLNLTRATASQIGQVFMLYSDPEKNIDAILSQAAQTSELLKHTDNDGVVHRLYAITDPEQIQTIQKVMADKNVFIADGHHRYETALNYFAETKNPQAEYQMMTFINTHNPGLNILPTHRLLKNVKDFNPEKFIALLRAEFDIAQLDYTDIVDKKEKYQMMLNALTLELENGEHAFGMYFNDNAFYVATLRDLKPMEEIAPDKSAAWRKLDVAILHKLILEKHLGIDEAALTAQTNVEYIKDIGSAALMAMDRVDEGDCQGLFFMNTVKPEDVEEVAYTGEKMPQKSTFFYPKIFSGLVINVLDK